MALSRLAFIVVIASALAVAAVVAQVPPAKPAAAAAPAGKACTLTIQFDNSGRHVMSQDTDLKIRTALAQKVFMVPSVQQVTLQGGIGQSSLLNRQAVAVYQVVGPTTNGKTACQNCEAGTKGGLFHSAGIKTAIEKATDTWIPGDKIEPQELSCKEVM